MTITVPEVAGLLGCSAWAVYQSVRRGDFPVQAIRVGRKILFSAAAVNQLLEAPSSEVHR